MPNYNYRPNDYMRRSQCPRQNVPHPARNEYECVIYPDEHECNSNSNECKSERCMYDPLNNLPTAMAYVPWQEFKDLYSAEKALCRGTIFEELDKPFLGKGGCCK